MNEWMNTERLAIKGLQAKLLYDIAFFGNMSVLRCVLRKLGIRWKRRQPERCCLKDDAEGNIHWNSKIKGDDTSQKTGTVCGQLASPPGVLSEAVVAEVFLWPQNTAGGSDWKSEIIVAIRNCFGRVSYPNVQEIGSTAATCRRGWIGWWREILFCRKSVGRRPISVWIYCY
jgi:hypothetical protein